MPIKFSNEKKQFHLGNDQFSYIMEVAEAGYLLQVHYGAPINDFVRNRAYPPRVRSSFSPNPSNLSGSGFSLDIALQEFPAYDAGDYRESMYEVTYADGTKATSMKYVSHEIFAGKKKLEGLPATYATDTEATTLEITMSDEIRGLRAILSYTVYENLPVIIRSVRYINASQNEIVLNKALSASIDFDHKRFDMIQMPGTWAREKQLRRNSLINGIHVLDSKRGASGSSQQPFMALASPETTEFAGEVHAFHFVYSGNFTIKTEVEIYEQTRVVVGINDFNFNWNLTANESFQAPEVVMVYSNDGLNGMSQAFHQLYRNHLARGRHQFKERPILTNNWETTYLNFTEDKLLELAKGAKKLGVELFVLDDGWFGERHTDKTSLGDWFENNDKLPNGLKGLANEIIDMGLEFGLWFEPEMISEESELFKAHPDWHIHVPGYPSSLGRNQLILDYSRKEVREAVYEMMVKILDEVPVTYIKWDMNRNMTEVGSVGRAPEAQMETSHRYMLGLYEILEKLTTRYPHILFENCSGGGGRFDPGMCHYMSQSWTSDNTDAIERVKIQYANSMIFPPVMICAQLSEIPNHQTNRMLDLKTRAAISMSANFGIMLNLSRETQEDLDQITAYISWYKENRKLIQFGDFYRLQNPFETNFGSWMFVDDKKEKAVLVYTQITYQASSPLNRVRLVGLDEDTLYMVEDMAMSGAELMNFGLYLNRDLFGDYQSKLIEITKV